MWFTGSRHVILLFHPFWTIVRESMHRTKDFFGCVGTEFTALTRNDTPICTQSLEIIPPTTTTTTTATSLLLWGRIARLCAYPWSEHILLTR